MPSLILFRHGNTFEADQTPTWVGARTDLPLTAQGEAQARAAGGYLKRQAVSCPIGAGPLKRTRQFAEIIAETVDSSIALDDRLTEIDYGLWENLTNVEIKARYGEAVYAGWSERGEWPEGMQFKPSYDELQKRLGDFLGEQDRELSKRSDAVRVAVTSNGILRVIYRIVTGHAPDKASKVATGNFCRLETVADGWRVSGWNEKPE